MGKHRFRFSDMIPNAWFYKLKDMSRSRSRSHHHMKKKQAAAATTSLQKPHISLPRYSYYFTTEPIKAHKVLYPSPVNPKASDTHFPDPSRKSSKKNTKRRTIYKPSPKHLSSSVTTATTCSCHTHPTLDSNWSKSNPIQSPNYFLSESESESEDDNFGFSQVSSRPNACDCTGLTCSTTDIIIDLNGTNYFTQKGEKLDGFEAIPELALPQILTKQAKFHKKKPQVTKFRTLEKINAHAHAHDHQSLSVKIVKEERFKTRKEQRTSSPARKSSSNSTGIRLSARANSPRIASKKLQAYAYARKSTSSSSKYSKSSQNTSLSESFIVVKSSVDPLRDFRDSMEEMIVENNLRTTKDLEDLLACYLSLNSNEYQDLIIKAFEQIWFDMTNLLL